MQNESCPISFESVNNSVLRIVSLSNLALLVAYFATGSIGWVIYIIADNLIRLIGYKQYSPLFRVATWLCETLHIRKEPYDIAPKKFALTIGTLMLFGVVGFWWLSMPAVSMILSAIMLFLLLLDGGFNYCVGCKMYSLVGRFI
jgi:hypothetical protein